MRWMRWKDVCDDVFPLRVVYVRWPQWTISLLADQHATMVRDTQTLRMQDLQMAKLPGDNDAVYLTIPRGTRRNI
jgi:hypothetical protein